MLQHNATRISELVTVRVEQVRVTGRGEVTVGSAPDGVACGGLIVELRRRGLTLKHIGAEVGMTAADKTLRSPVGERPVSPSCPKRYCRALLFGSDG